MIDKNVSREPNEPSHCQSREEECCVRNMCPIFLCDITGHCVHSAVTHHQHHHQHLPSGGAGRRAGAAEAGEEG